MCQVKQICRMFNGERGVKSRETVNQNRSLSYNEQIMSTRKVNGKFLYQYIMNILQEEGKF